MKRFSKTLHALALCAAVVGLPQAGQAGDDVRLGVIQAYDGQSVRIAGETYLLSETARRQLEAVLERYPGSGLINLPIQFESKRRYGQRYIESLHVPRGEA